MGEYGSSLLISRLQGLRRLPVKIFDGDSRFLSAIDSHDCSKVPVIEFHRSDGICIYSRYFGPIAVRMMLGLYFSSTDYEILL